ncbi:MAG TPA: ATPase, T2SS/T4P/T4SS family [Candidatus Eisenbacteria bacterium]|nr:ATPase, T2SS/T4P/T4SS family [Candidatus Eisenbacteria bacterium]
MITKSDTLLAKVLVDKGYLSTEALRPTLDEAAKSKDSLFALLVKKEAVPEERLLRTLAELLRLPFIEQAADLKAEPSAIEKVPLKVAEYYKIAPLRLDKRKLTIAVSAPLDLRTQDDIRAHLGCEIEIELAREKDVAEAIKRFYGFAAGTIGEIMAQAPASSSAAPVGEGYEKIENIEKLAGDASVARLVNQIILEAYRKRATDIHIEPYRGKVKLRYRIDGILYNANVQPEMSRLILPILSRIKIMSNLNIVERRLPQDGRAIVKVEDTQLDLRVSSIPTPYGESVVIRMLPMNRVFSLEQLGLSAEQLQTFETLINKPHGIIFITGPTGSGKSTTLYACLNRINTDERKIITIEDPVEYEMDGVTQIQVVQSIGLDFAKGLRSMLRHDPDVMMVGEVRDLETAEMAIRVALTGHLVFSTLHTNDAASGITRLVDIGIQPYLVASSVEAFIAQRLVRRICPECKEEDPTLAPQLKAEIAAELGMRKSDFPVYRGRGCHNCNNTGFWGRLAIYELLLLNEKIQDLVMKKAAASDVKREAVFQGMRTLRQDGWLKVLGGLTTVAEILEATQGDQETAPLPPEEPPADETPKERAAARPAAKSQEPKKGEEGRVFMRLNHTVNVHYKIIRPPQAADAEDAAEEYAVTRNISAGGLVFVAQEKIPVGAILEIRLELPGDEIECLARVLRQKEIDSRKFYEVAVCFLDLSTAVRSKLDKFVLKETK